jgi:hypothetical protein
MQHDKFETMENHNLIQAISGEIHNQDKETSPVQTELPLNMSVARTDC